MMMKMMIDMTKKLCFKVLILGVIILLFTSCKEDVLDMLEKREYFSFIVNESGNDVKIIFDKGSSIEKSYDIRTGTELEIPDTDRWSMYVKTPQYDTVWFEFADSSSYIHCYALYHDRMGQDSIVYTPAENNIFDCSSDGTGAWKLSKIRTQKYRMEYTVR